MLFCYLLWTNKPVLMQGLRSNTISKKGNIQKQVEEHINLPGYNAADLKVSVLLPPQKSHLQRANPMGKY